MTLALLVFVLSVAASTVSYLIGRWHGRAAECDRRAALVWTLEQRGRRR